MSLQAADFTTAVTTGSTNPSVFGYHHGPIPNPNPGWVPERIRLALANGITRPPALNAQDVANPPNPASVLSSINTLVCDIDLGGGQMCGRVFGDQPTYRRHVRTFHPGAVTNPARKNTSIAENLSGSKSVHTHEYSGGWSHWNSNADPPSTVPSNLSL
ncbi:hypothetical protein BD289DRAFT_76778 [Coniella lustricola]|uniref:C2H2-type domain-containing protein n=1 Tax=Coniella lustricola TaxID=2025994 RepID=A0A2T2ZZJ2_9PEZI|nr:hypothetical protein BD289DRAFT_76778 [Coniella lustricola]